MLLPWPAGFVQDLVRFMRGKPLIPQVNGQAGQLAQLGRKGLRLLGLRAQLAGKVQRIAHHDPRHAEFARQPSQPAQVLAPVMVTLDRHHRLRGQAQLVTHGHADAAVADVEAKIAWTEKGLRVQNFTPNLDLKALQAGVKGPGSSDMANLRTAYPVQSKEENPLGELARLK